MIVSDAVVLARTNKQLTEQVGRLKESLKSADIRYAELKSECGRWRTRALEAEERLAAEMRETDERLSLSDAVLAQPHDAIEYPIGDEG